MAQCKICLVSSQSATGQRLAPTNRIASRRLVVSVHVRNSGGKDPLTLLQIVKENNGVHLAVR